jgi:predicted transcriptional regulator
MLTKNQIDILKVFTARITEQFSRREIAKIIKKDSSQVQKAIKPLINQGILAQTKNQQLILNYRQNHMDLAYVEHHRITDFLNQGRNKSIKLFANDVLATISEDLFVLLIFGSAVETNKPRDIDILLVIGDADRLEENEKVLYNVSRNYPGTKFDINVVCVASVYEMLSSREQKNVMNETLNKHLIIYGSETFYRMLSNGRK